jgi:hypothetical protein
MHFNSLWNATSALLNYPSCLGESGYDAVLTNSGFGGKWAIEQAFRPIVNRSPERACFFVWEAAAPPAFGPIIRRDSVRVSRAASCQTREEQADATPTRTTR